MSYEFYKILHLTGVILVFSGLIGLLTMTMSGVVAAGKTKTLIFVSHGLGLFLALVGGFGLLARLGLARDMPTWVYGKLVIWIILGGAIAVVKRNGRFGGPIFLSLVSLFIIASYLAVIKPFTV
jgi:hypothetical protein